MSVNFNPNFAIGKNPAFGRNQENKSGSYLGSTAKGAIGGGIIGSGLAVGLKSAAAMDVAVDSVNLSKVKAAAEGMIGSRPVKLFAIAGAVIGAAALVINRAFNGDKDRRSFENLKPIS